MPAAAKTSHRLALIAATATAIVAASTSPVWAKPSGSSGGPTGIDVSYPQCGDSLPGGAAFAIIGVNGGLANDYNTCLGGQFSYAQALTQTTAQATAQTYLNTADPGNRVADWPSPAQPGAYGNLATPDGTTCDYASGTSGPGANSPACAYVYGYDMVAGISYPGGAVPGDLNTFHSATGQQLFAQPVWLDVETANSWQTGTSGLAMNVSALQGMVDAVRKAATAVGATAPAVGIYSTSSQWNQITGTPTGPAAGNLGDAPVWIPGARSQKGAVSNCAQAGFTGGTVSITQWFANPYDDDHSCIG